MNLMEKYEQSVPPGFNITRNKTGEPDICPDMTDYTGIVGAKCGKRCPELCSRDDMTNCFTSCFECWNQEYLEIE